MPYAGQAGKVDCMSIDIAPTTEMPAADAALLEIDRASVMQGDHLALDRLTVVVRS